MVETKTVSLSRIRRTSHVASQFFFCPDEDSAAEFMLQTDVSVWPKVEYSPIEEKRVIVFCTFHAFTPEKMCRVLGSVGGIRWENTRVLFFGDPRLIGPLVRLASTRD